MKNNQFKAFEEAITKADKTSTIWWDMFYFMDLTEKQNDRTYDILVAKGFEVKDGAVTLPSGVSLKRSTASEMKKIRCNFRKAEYSNGWIVFITDSVAIVDAKKDEWCGRTKEHAVARANAVLNPLGYTVSM